MRSLCKLLVLSVPLFSPFLIGCSSQLSEKQAEKLEAQEEGTDPGELDDSGREQKKGR